MPLNNAQLNNLNAAITNYGFPAVYFNFALNAPVAAANMVAVETHIHNQLTSANPQSVLHGLANVLYWGYAQNGYRNVRVNNFLAGANAGRTQNAQPERGYNTVLFFSFPSRARLAWRSMDAFGADLRRDT